MSDSEFNFWLGITGGIAIGMVIVYTLLVIMYDGKTSVDVPKFGTALCEGMNLEYNNYTNDGILKINCVDKGTYTKPLIDGVVSVTKKPSAQLQVKTNKECVIYNLTDRTTYYYDADYYGCEQ